MAFSENLQSFFCEFGVDCTLASGQVVRGIFENPHAMALGDVSVQQPALDVLDADVATHAIGAGSAISIGAVAYTVSDPQPDGAGITTLQLQRA